jgi:RNA polymerase sigma-70 factor (ECF subfamily)
MNNPSWCGVTSQSVRAAGASDASAELPGCYRAFETELDFVHRMLRRSGASRADADDLAQEVFLVLWRRWDDYDPRRPLRPWLAGIIFRVAHDHFRRTRREVPSGFVDREDPRSPLDDLATARARALVLRALSALPERQRAVMILHELEGMAISELAEALLVPISTLYSRLKKARENFARQVRRLQRQALARKVPDIEALLAAERTPRPEPPERRQRALGRVRALIASPRPPVSPRPRRSPWPLVVGLLLVAVALGLILGLARRPTRRIAGLAARPALRGQIAPGLSRALIGYWRFDEGAGTIAHDGAGNGTDCILQQPDAHTGWTVGPLGSARTFGGLGWLACDHPRFANATSTDLTVALWVKRTERQPGYHALVTRQTGDSNLDHFFVGMRGDLILLVSHVWGGKLFHPAPPVGRWFHLAMVHGHGEVVLFVDGIPVARRPSTEAVPAEGDTAITVGGGVNGPDPTIATQRFIGAIDELAVYRRALSDGEVKMLAEGARPALSR